MAETLSELKSLAEDILRRKGMPTIFSVQIIPDEDDLSTTFPARISDELFFYFDINNPSDTPTGVIRCEKRFLSRPSIVQYFAILESARSSMRFLAHDYFEENAMHPSWSAKYFNLFISSQSSTPILRYPAGSFIRVCTECNRLEIFDVCSVAFSANTINTMASDCPHCGNNTFVRGITKQDIFTITEFAFAFDSSPIAKHVNINCHYCDFMHDLTEAIENDLIHLKPQDLALKLWKAKGGMNFEEALDFLNNHPIFKGHFLECFDLLPVETCLRTRRAEDSDSIFKNDTWEIWIEAGPYVEFDSGPCPTDDPDLNCGGWSVPESIIHLAHSVRFHYGTDGRNRFTYLDI